jgi:hypothetical protein
MAESLGFGLEVARSQFGGMNAVVRVRRPPMLTMVETPEVPDVNHTWNTGT